MQNGAHLRLPREELYQLVWSKPMQQIAKGYGISDRAMAKLCLRKQVPVPPRGYWAKKLAGNISGQPPLPALATKAVAPAKPVKRHQIPRPQSKLSNFIEDKDRNTKQKLRAHRRLFEESTHHTVLIEGWNFYHTFGLNGNYNPLRPSDEISFMYRDVYREMRSLNILGRVIEPSPLKQEPIELSLYPEAHYNESQREKGFNFREDTLPTSIGALQKEKKRIWGHISIPEDALGLILTAVSSGNVKYLTFTAEKMRYGRAYIRSYSLKDKSDLEEKQD